MWGCLIAGLLILLLFVLVPPLLWPFLLIAVILLGVLAAVFGVFRGHRPLVQPIALAIRSGRELAARHPATSAFADQRPIPSLPDIQPRATGLTSRLSRYIVMARRYDTIRGAPPRRR
jgi:hypothetical protein